MIEKIKLGWVKYRKDHDTCTALFVLKDEEFTFGVFDFFKEVTLFNGMGTIYGEENKTMGFPQDKKISSVEEGQEFCQQWLDDYIDSLNKKTEVQDRVLSVLQDIWSGKTELKWEKIVLFEKEREFSQGFFCDGILYFHVEEDVASYLKPTTPRGISALDDYVMSFGLGDSSYFDSERRKRDFQDLYNKALLYVAAKGLA